MSYLLYFIFKNPGMEEPSCSPTLETIRGVAEEPIRFVSDNGLSAAISNIPQPDLISDISYLLAYQKAIETFHAHHTVIPMRYGCTFEKEFQVLQFLKERGKEFEKLLHELEGCVEMGIRILLSGPPQQEGEDKKEDPPSEIRNLDSFVRGQNYLMTRKMFYEQKTQLVREIDILAERYCRLFSGLFIQWKKEYVPSPTSMLSLYFLVPRGSVETFRRVYRDMSSKESVNLLLSGPWPPYNFVLPVHPSGQNVVYGSRNNQC